MSENNGQVLEAFVGLQWGDEGKGKIIGGRIEHINSLNDNKRTVVIRYQGADNAGHSSFVRDSTGNLIKFVTHAAPSGLPYNKDVAIAAHVALNPISFINEVNEARKLFNFNARILISERTSMIFDYHRKLDAWRENSNDSGNKVGSTKRGVGPVYEDRARRTTSINFEDYISNEFPDILRKVINRKKPELELAGIIIGRNNYFEELLDIHEPIRKELAQYTERLEYRLRDYLNNGDHILIEGAQGTGLDVDQGTIPYTTSSHLLSHSAFAATGLPRRKFKVYGVEKLYPTRVGSGIMPTFDFGDFGTKVGKNAGEIGASTGRKRDVGYPDLVFLKHSAMINDCDGIITTRVDNVQDMEIKVCTGYDYKGNLTDEVPLDLRNVKPVYDKKRFIWHLWEGPGDLSDPLKVDAALRQHRQKYVKEGFYSLPSNCKDYFAFKDNFVGVPTVGISIGPESGEIINLIDKFGY